MSDAATQDQPTADAGEAPAKRLYLIDGSAYIFRAYHALKPMTRPDGTPVNAVYGFTQMLLKLIEDALNDAAADYFAVIFDTARTSFRNEIYPDYKANRPEPPEDLRPQFALVRDATRALGLPCIEMEGFEADDIIATYARIAAEAGVDVTIVSSDKDLMQLVNGRVSMFDPIKNRPIRDAEVREKFGVGPDRVIDVQALAGDSSDNVPGVPGIGIKTAAQLIEEYGDLDTLLARAGEIKQPKRRENLVGKADLARVSRDLVTLRTDVPVEDGIERFALSMPDADRLIPFLEEQGFRSLVARVASRALADGKREAPAIAPPSEAEYVLVQDEAALVEWIARARKRGVVGFDTETDSLDAMRARLVGFSLATAPGVACYVPVGHGPAREDGTLDLDAGTRPEQIPLDRALALLGPLLGDPAILKVGQNLKYDALVLRKYGVDLVAVDDTMVLSYVLEAGAHGHGLDELAELHLGVETIKYKDVAGSGKAQIPFAEVPLEAARDYAAEDADVALRLHGILRPAVTGARLTTVYETMERPLIPVLVAMEEAGIAVDRSVLERLSRDFAERMATLEEKAHTLAGEAFNLGSPRQLGEILFDRMGLEGGRKTKGGAGYGTGADVLEGLAAMGHELPQVVLDWRQFAKLKSTYADALVGQINPDTGRVHTSLAMTIAATGRLSSTDPNLQNIPVRTEEGRKIREAFVPADGHSFVSLDYSQIELRLLAHVADMDKLKQAFRDGQDIHATTAAEVFGTPVEGMDPMVRRRAKAINFGIIYGISAFGLARQLGISKGDAASYIDAYFERYPGIRDYMETTKAFARRHGFVVTPFGRRIHLRGITSKNPNERGFAERQSINAPLQGGAADIIKRAMIRVKPALDGKKLDARLLLQVHDELLFEVPDAQVEETIATVRTVMEAATRPVLELSVPLVVDAGTGRTWAQAH